MPEGDKKFKILVTSFEPFEDDINISEAVASELKSGQDFELIKVTLPNDYLAAKTLIENTIRNEKPDFVLSLGEINSSTKIDPSLNIEITYYAQGLLSLQDKSGCNFSDYGYFNPDMAKAAIICQHEKLNEFIINTSSKINPDIYASKEDIKSKGFAGCFSLFHPIFIEQQSSYLCNFTFYTALNAMEEIGKPGQASFLHITDPIKLRTSDNESARTGYLFDIKNYTTIVQETLNYLPKYTKHDMEISYSELDYSKFLKECNTIEKENVINTFGDEDTVFLNSIIDNSLEEFDELFNTLDQYEASQNNPQNNVVNTKKSKNKGIQR